MLLNYVVLFEQRPYLLKIQLNHVFLVRFVQISRNRKIIIHLLDKIKCPINSTDDLEILSNQIRLAKINYFARKFQQFKGDCKSTWKQINSIIRPNRINKKYISNKICENGITCT